MLNTKDLNAAYGVIPVLHDVNLDIREGELVALLGANGAGKTTLLNNISGVLPVKSGAISFMGTEIQHLSADGSLDQESLEKSKTNDGKSLRPVSHPEGALRTAGQPDERRRTADAGHCPRIDGPAEIPDDRRTLSGAESAHHVTDLRRH